MACFKNKVFPLVLLVACTVTTLVRSSSAFQLLSKQNFVSSRRFPIFKNVVRTISPAIKAPSIRFVRLSEPEKHSSLHAAESSSSIGEITGNNELATALDLIRRGFKLYKELNSTQIDLDELEAELLETQNVSIFSKLANKTKTNTHHSTKKVLSHDDSTKTKFDQNTTANGSLETSQELPEPLIQLQKKLDAFNWRAKKTRILLLKKMASWAFDTCANSTTLTSQDPNHPNKKKTARGIDDDAFYSAILLVHLQLAKHVGVAACHPPNRDQIQELFLLADQDKSGYLSRDEFTNAVVVACTPITSRIVVYYTTLALLPVLVTKTMLLVSHVVHKLVPRRWQYSSWSVPFGLTALFSPQSALFRHILSVVEWTVQHVFGIVLFSIVVPTIFARMDRRLRRRARRRTRQSLWWLADAGKPTKAKSTSHWLEDWRKAIYSAQDAFFSTKKVPSKESSFRAGGRVLKWRPRKNTKYFKTWMRWTRRRRQEQQQNDNTDST